MQQGVQREYSNVLILFQVFGSVKPWIRVAAFGDARRQVVGQRIYAVLMHIGILFQIKPAAEMRMGIAAFIGAASQVVQQRVHSCASDIRISGAPSRTCACRCDGQFPGSHELRFRTLHAGDAGACSGASRSLSAASAASLRIAEHADDDRRRAKAAFFQRYPPCTHGRLR
jgi:hypothetical protein